MKSYNYKLPCGLLTTALVTLQLFTFVGISAAQPENTAERTAVFAGGCFWCMEKPFERLTGVSSVVSGYAGGDSSDANYQAVSSGKTKHLEAVEVKYNPDLVSYQKLLQTFKVNIDPFDGGGQFCDRGHQYTSAIFTSDRKQEQHASLLLDSITPLKRQEVVTKIFRLEKFYPAEEYHQDYYKKNPLRYNSYRLGCGRDRRLNKLWKK